MTTDTTNFPRGSSAGLLCGVAVDTNVSEDHAASIFALYMTCLMRQNKIAFAKSVECLSVCKCTSPSP